MKLIETKLIIIFLLFNLNIECLETAKKYIINSDKMEKSHPSSFIENKSSLRRGNSKL